MDLLASPTTALARLALDAAALRHQAIAHNIANSGTPGFVPLRVNFEQQLGQVRQQLLAGTLADAPALQGVVPRLETDAGGATGVAALDTQLVQLADNSLQYQALLRALSRRGSIMGLAVNEGRR